jgi:hypothetical protein
MGTGLLAYGALLISDTRGQSSHGGQTGVVGESRVHYGGSARIAHTPPAA